MDVSIIQRFLGSSGKKMMALLSISASTKYNGEICLVRKPQNLISFDSTEFWGLEEV